MELKKLKTWWLIYFIIIEPVSLSSYDSQTTAETEPKCCLKEIQSISMIDMFICGKETHLQIKQIPRTGRERHYKVKT